jgi:hypothetical protein
MELASLRTVEQFFEVLPPEKRRLGLIVFVSILAHTAAFFVVRVTYPPLEIKPQPRLRATLQSPETTGAGKAASMAFWNDIQDPSLLILPRGALLGKDSDVREVKPRLGVGTRGSGTVPTVALAGDPEFLPTELSPLTERAQAALEPEIRHYQFPPSAAPSEQATQIVLDPALEADLGGPLPVLASPEASLLSDAGVTMIRLGVGADGRVRYLLVEESGGRAAIDDLAVQGLQRLVFKPKDGTRLRWGRVLVSWRFKPAAAARPVEGAAP